MQLTRYLMSGSGVVKGTIQHVRPLLSVDKAEARRHVLKLFKAWNREIPHIGKCTSSQIHYIDTYIVLNFDVDFVFILCEVEMYHVPVTAVHIRAKIREKFLKHKDLTDIRVIDMLVVKGRQDLKETEKGWKQPTHLMRFWDDPVESKPKDFLSKFLEGKD